MKSISPPPESSSRTSRDYLKFILKLTLGTLLISYVLRSKMVDFQQLEQLFSMPRFIALGLCFMLVSILCCAVRWHLLVKAQGLSLSFKDVFELTMIGNFFNTFMPGAVGGDLIKAWYVAGQEPRRKTKAIFTVLLDRLFGLWVFFCFAASTLFLYRGWIVGHPQLAALAAVLWSVVALSVVGGIFFSHLRKLETAGALEAFSVRPPHSEARDSAGGDADLPPPLKDGGRGAAYFGGFDLCYHRDLQDSG